MNESVSPDSLSGERKVVIDFISSYIKQVLTVIYTKLENYFPRKTWVNPKKH